MKTLVNVYAFIMGCLMVYGKVALDCLDWLGKKLVGLLDNDFFAGAVWTYAILTAWDLITK